MRFVMDMYYPNTAIVSWTQAQQPVAPASGVIADEGESKALRELAALDERVSAARLVV
jgi:hypothetical protein